MSAARRPSARKKVSPKRRPQRSRARKASLMDHAIAALPFEEATLRKIATWSILGFVGAVALLIASVTGALGAAGTAMAEGIGRAGFKVKEIEVTGIDRMERMSVYAIALDQQSRAMPLVDLDQVRERLLDYGWIADARVSRRLPDTLVIDIVEREPAAIWQHEGQLMLIDATGVLLEPVAASAMPDLPLVIGEGANAQEPAFQRLLAAAPALKPQVTAATWVGSRRWDLRFESGEVLALPEGEREAAKALVEFARRDGTQGLLGRGYVRFDMRDPTRLVVRMPGQVTREISGEGGG
jgi:cell division protein FtsQ